MLAVYLGLRTGFAVYNNSGCLTSLFSRQFTCLTELKDAIHVILNEIPQISHVCVEGDAVLRTVWVAEVGSFAGPNQPELPVIPVSPKEWRRKMLTKREQTNGPSAKAAARLIARQIMWRHGLTDVYYEGSLNTDSAEAVLLGYYVVHERLHWAQNTKGNGFEDTLVERYSNGNVVLPPKKKIEKTPQ